MNHSLDLLNTDLFFRFVINFITLMILLRGIYYRNDAQSESSSGFLVFGNGVFFVTALLHNVEMSMGFAFGLFAVFSMLRYRTETLTVRDMTYLFVLIAISLLSSVSTLSMVELAGINTVLCLITWFSETSLFAKTIEHQMVRYENIELIKPAEQDRLYQDLSQRLGVTVTNVEIGDIDFLRDSALLKVFYLRADSTISKQRED